VGNDIGHEVDLRHGGQSYRLHVARAAPGGWYRLSADGDVVDVLVERLGRSRARLTVGTRAFRIVSSIHGPDHLVEVDGDAHRFSQDDGGVVRAPAAAVVVSVSVAPGDEVTVGTRLVLLEAMKMEVAITAPVSGTVGEVLVAPNVQVEAGAPLLRLEPGAHADHDDPPDASARLRFPVLTDSTAGDDRTRCLELLDALRSFVLGYDLLPADAIAMAGDYQVVRGRLVGDEDVVRAELDVLDSFADLCTLTRERRDAGEADTSARASREWFNIFLRSLDPEREGLPERFRQRLSRAMSHYGVADLVRTSELEEALYRVFQAQQRRQPGGGGVGLVEAQRHVDPAPCWPTIYAYADRLAAAPTALPGRRRSGAQCGTAVSTSPSSPTR
jgi:biotin carboxyl carrier protein